MDKHYDRGWIRALVALTLMLALTPLGGCKKKAGDDRAAGEATTSKKKGDQMSAAQPKGAKDDGMGSAADRAFEAAESKSKSSAKRPQRRARRRAGAAGATGVLGAPPSRPAPYRAGKPPSRHFADLQVVAGRKIPKMYFKHWGVNPTIDTEEAHVSTFGADVDTASFALARGYLQRNSMPPEAAIRVEEFINAFDYGYAPPRGKRPVKVHVELVPSPNRKGYHVLRIGLKGSAPKAARRKPAHLVFVIDASATMARKGRLALVKRSLRLLVPKLGRTDRVSIVAFDTRAHVVLPTTAGQHKAKIRRAITSLKAQGATSAQTALAMGFRLAAKAPRRYARRVILCSDGISGNGVTSAATLPKGIARQVTRGVTLTALGFGMGHYNDRAMEQLARAARGSYHYVDRLGQARRLFAERLTSTNQVVARDLKLQVTFDKRAVSRYRLLGYESRMLQSRAFRKRRTPAGELGAGESLTALYEVKLRAASRRGLGTLRLRYKPPAFAVEQQLRVRLPRAAVRTSFAQGSAATQLAVVVAAFAEKLRGSYWSRNLGYAQILTLLKAIRPTRGMSSKADLQALGALVRRATRLDKRGDRFAQVLPLARMTFDRVPVSR